MTMNTLYMNIKCLHKNACKNCSDGPESISAEQSADERYTQNTYLVQSSSLFFFSFFFKFKTQNDAIHVFS